MTKGLFVVAVLLAGLGPSAGAADPGGSPAGGRVGPANYYPDSNLTPGATLPDVTAQQVCTPGYAKSVRKVSDGEKKAVFERYHLQDTPNDYEVDHFISLELGGSNDVDNLWPEPYNPKPGAREKDKVENELHRQVCSGKMTLQQAQDIEKNDWYAYYLNMPKVNKKAMESAPAGEAKAMVAGAEQPAPVASPAAGASDSIAAGPVQTPR